MVPKPTSDLYRTIFRQPDVVRAILARDRSSRSEVGERLARSRRVFLTGTGTSHHAAIVGEQLLRSAGIEAYARSAFDFVRYPMPLREEDAVLVISHRGSKRYGSQAIPKSLEAGAYVVGITGEGSPMRGPSAILTTSPQETSSTHTMSYLGSLTVMAALAREASRPKGVDVTDLAQALDHLPTMLETVLSSENVVVPAAEALARSGRTVLQGAGPNAATAREGALKVKESSYLTAEGWELEDFLHGGLQPVARGDVAVPIVPAGASVERAKDLVRALGLVGAATWVVRDEVVGELDLEGTSSALPTFVFPHVPEELSPLLAVVPLQLLAAYTAQIRGTNADSFREDDPIFQKALAAYPL
jgi:glutamine---fructose-6-phosphate transaminase (isomerizing)